jgi:hypothetical protein
VLRAEGIPTPKASSEAAILSSPNRSIRASIIYSGNADSVSSNAQCVVANIHKGYALLATEERPDKWSPVRLTAAAPTVMTRGPNCRLFPDDPRDGSRENGVMIRCDLRTVQRQLKLLNEPSPKDLWVRGLPARTPRARGFDLSSRRQVLIELTMTISKPRRMHEANHDAGDPHYSSDTRPDVRKASRGTHAVADPRESRQGKRRVMHLQARSDRLATMLPLQHRIATRRPRRAMTMMMMTTTRPVPSGASARSSKQPNQRVADPRVGLMWWK